MVRDCSNSAAIAAAITYQGASGVVACGGPSVVIKALDQVYAAIDVAQQARAQIGDFGARGVAVVRLQHDRRHNPQDGPGLPDRANRSSIRRGPASSARATASLYMSLAAA